MKLKIKKLTIKELSEEFKSFSEFCREYGIDRQSAYNWIGYKCLPSAKMLVKINEKSGNRLDFERTLKEFTNAQVGE